MHECSKSILRRLSDVRFATKYFVGQGIDIGGKPDPLVQYGELFPGMRSCRTWDLEDGDAQYLEGIEEGTLDFVHSSHCLEHMVDPSIAMENWLRVLKPGGFLVCLIPDEDLYEQGVFPSTYNGDHKFTFTISKSESWSPKSINVTEFLSQFSSKMQIIKIELLDATFRYRLNRFDQTLTPIGECAIEFIVRRKTPLEIENKGLYSKIEMK